MKKLTASVVGGGNGGKLSLKALANSEYFELVAVTDLRSDVRGQLKQIFPGIRTYATHEEMFADSPTDVVCVSTWPPSHEEVAMDALKLPLKGILVEKPLGHTAALGRKILEAVKAKQIPMAVPHGLLAKRTPLEIIERVHKGEIGALKLVEIQNTRPPSESSTDPLPNRNVPIHH
jgi:predicted dehydrogenase